MTGPLTDQQLDEATARIEHWISEHPSRAYAARFPVDDVQAVLAENQRLRDELADAAGYLAVIHRHANRHDVLGANLACAGCALLDRIETAQDGAL